MRGSPIRWARKLEHPVVIDSVEKASNVSLGDIIHLLLLDGASQIVQALVGTAIGSVPVAAVFEGLLVDRSQDPFYRKLNQLVFKAADPKRAAFSTAGLGDISSPLWLWPVLHIL
jgi:hypothetical protein